jgi:glycosyltransferase involved in cell wall biosynthesis
MPTVSVIMPVYNVERYVARAIDSVLAQSFKDFELILIDDGGDDGSVDICYSYKDARIKIFSQVNRGLAGARNTGIRLATGRYIALLDSDDLWHVDKLANHVAHLDKNPKVGVSYSGSAMIDEHDRPLGVSMQPRMRDIDAAHILCRNPIGNGSAPVMRRGVFEAIAYQVVRDGVKGVAFFDETFRYAEDIECWMRIACTTAWQFEGIPGDLTLYRIVSNSLSANTDLMYHHWERMYQKVALLNPKLIEEHGTRARGYQLRYYARRNVVERHGWAALRKFVNAVATHPGMWWEEPRKTTITFLASIALTLKLHLLYPAR